MIFSFLFCSITVGIKPVVFVLLRLSYIYYSLISAKDKRQDAGKFDVTLSSITSHNTKSILFYTLRVVHTIVLMLYVTSCPLHQSPVFLNMFAVKNCLLYFVTYLSPNS